MSLESDERPARKVRKEPSNTPPTGDREEPTTFRPSTARKPDPSSARPGGTKVGSKKPLVADEPLPEANGPGRLERIVMGKVGMGQIATFCRQLAAYQEAGVDLSKALRSLSVQFGRSALGPVIARIDRSIRRGDTLSEAFGHEPAFDKLFQNMMKVAEARGGVPETLRELAKHYEARYRLYRQAKSALIYPICVLVMGAGVSALFVFGILPIFVSLLEDISKGKELPFPTRVLMGLGHFAKDIGWWVVPSAVVGSIFGLRFLYKSPKGKQLIDEILWSVPVFGLLMRKIDTTRFARSLGLLLGGGIDIESSLQLSQGVLRLAPLQSAVASARAQVAEGIELSLALASTHRFSSDVIAIVNSGEETGKLPESLDRLADDYEEQVEHMIRNLGALVQPLVYVAMGGLVLFIILAIFLPYLSMIKGLS